MTLGRHITVKSKLTIMTDDFFASLQKNDSERIRSEISKAATDYGGRCEVSSFHSDVGFDAETNLKDRNWAVGLNELQFVSSVLLGHRSSDLATTSVC